MTISPDGFFDRNLRIQGFDVSSGGSRRVAPGLRFVGVTCLALAAGAAAQRSAPALAALTVIAAVAGWSAHHPFDHLWNGVVRHAVRRPPLPPTPRRRRHAFKVAAGWLAGVTLLVASGHVTAGVVLLGGLMILCAVQTLTHICIPSMVMALVEARRAR
jgi:hypothetical protein